VQEVVYFQRIYKKITPIDVYVSGTTDQKTYPKKFRVSFSPLSLLPGSAYAGSRYGRKFGRGKIRILITVSPQVLSSVLFLQIKFFHLFLQMFFFHLQSECIRNY